MSSSDDDIKSVCSGVSSTDEDDGYGKSNTCTSNSLQNSDEILTLSSSSKSSSCSNINSLLKDMKIKPAKEALYKPEFRVAMSFECIRYSTKLDFFRYPINCGLCDKHFTTIAELNAHIANIFHKINVTIENFSFLKKIHDSNKLQSSINIVSSIKMKSNSTCDDDFFVQLSIKNVLCYFSIQLRSIYWMNTSDNTIMAVDGKMYEFPVILKPNESLTYEISSENFAVGDNYKLLVIYRPGHLDHTIEYNFCVTSKPIITMKLNKLDHYFPEPTLRSLHQCEYKENDEKSFNVDEKVLIEKINDFSEGDRFTRLNTTNFYDMFKIMLQMEDEIGSKRVMSHDQYDQQVKYECEKRYSMKINNDRLENAISEYARVWILPMSMRKQFLEEQKLANAQTDASKWKPKKQRIYGTIVKIKSDEIYIDFMQKLDLFTMETNVQPHHEKYFLRFMVDRTTIALEHRALDILKQQNIVQFLFPSKSNERSSDSMHNLGSEINWVSSDINAEQKSAVKNILERTSYPYPYILFGPPGTGKTKTLVEAIAQIYKQNEKSVHVLVCATSNSACDEVAKRLLKSIPSNQIFRMYAKTADTSDASTELLAASNFSKKVHYYPDLKMLYQYKIVICTLTTAGRLSQAGINTKHFSYIFIDESGSATEPQTLIAIAGLCSSINKINASIIFAGDPEQLGPVIRSQMAVKMGYDISMLERLMNTDVYKRDEKTRKFNHNYVTQLTKNYRSHESLLKVSNELFYENTLEACADNSATDWFLNSTFLKSPQFPLIFHSIQGVTRKEGKDPSLYNTIEVDVVISYLRKLFSSNIRKIKEVDIGIISPYRRQCEEITTTCALNQWDNIQIGSVEIFQGQEKPIIIASTVRSNVPNIGFLNNPKRLNVLLTRAKCLLIIIGDAKTLSMDKYWAHVIKYCKENNAFIS